MMLNKGRKFMTSQSVDHMLPSSLYTFLFLCSSLLYCSATDTIKTHNSISDQGGETLVSAGGTFELGFFTPHESSSTTARFVGIWYYNFTPQTVVWVANRDQPLSDRNGSFGVAAEDGNLKVLDGKGKVKWSTNLQLSSSNDMTMNLLDSGNLVLSDAGTSSEYVWESFNNPTDTFLPGMIMTGKTYLNLTSWKSLNNPAPGNYMFKRDKDGVEEIITGKWTTYWRSGQTGDFISPDVANLLSNSSTGTSSSSSTLQNKIAAAATGSTVNARQASCGRASPYTACLPNRNKPPIEVNDSTTAPTVQVSRLVMSYTGELQYYVGVVVGEKFWSLIWWAPKNRCGSLNACGNFGSCNSNNSLVCKCLPGFVPSWGDSWDFGDFSDGCVPKSNICENNRKIDTFLNLTMMKVREANTNFTAGSEIECRKACLDRCDCKAYSYLPENSSEECSIWNGDLSNLQEESAYGGRNFSVRVNLSDIDSISRSCRTCGTYIIPYPLSTRPDCGDPMYSSFQCNISTGQVTFKAPNGTYYRVINIDPNPHRPNFVIQAKDESTCKAGNLTGTFLQPNQSYPFRVIHPPCSSNSSNFKGRNEIELSWNPPLEPTCNSSADCKDWPNSTCNNATLDGTKMCHCNPSFRWDGFRLTCTQGEDASFCINM